VTSTPPTSDATEYCSYADFGQRFFEIAVTEERILGAVSGLAGDTFEFGPIGVGPGRLAKVHASGLIGTASVAGRPGEEMAFVLTIPVDVRLVVDLGVDEHRFRAAVTVNLNLTARAAEPLRVVIDVQPPTKDDVQVTIKAESLRASVLQMVAGVDNEIRRFVAKYVAKEIDKPHIRKARDIDVAARISGAWSSPGRP
jgi:hypothetical protein